MKSSSFNFKLKKTNLVGYYWQPEDVKAVVVLVHGMGEHIRRYEDFVIPNLVNNGLAVVGFDQFGHGKSGGKRGHCPSYEALLNSIDYVINKSVSLFPDLPIIAYGHSMGGNLVLNYALRRDHQLKGIIATSPFLRLAFQPPQWKMTFGKIMMKIWPSLTLSSELETEAISRDVNEVKRYQEDPMVHDKVSPMFSFPVIDAGEWAINKASTLKTATIILHGTADRIIDYKGSETFCEISEKATIKLFKDGYHELHHDLCKEEFIASILDWISDNISF